MKRKLRDFDATAKWIQDTKQHWATAGGDPVWCCPICGKGLHVHGIEHPVEQTECPDCHASITGYSY